MSVEKWYFIQEDILYQHIENDGHTYMRRGQEPFDIPLCSVEEAKDRFPKELISAGVK